jgi:hypothetical protein
VLQTNKKAEIQAEAKRLAGGSEDSKKWLPHYQAAKRTIKENLLDEEKERYEAEAKAWEEEGIPRDIQAEYEIGIRGGTPRLINSQDRLPAWAENIAKNGYAKMEKHENENAVL